MKFFLISKEGDGLGLAWKLKQEGHEVAGWIKSRKDKHNYDGMLLKVERWENWIDKDTVIIFDTTGGGRTADRLRASGHHIFAGSSFADLLEEDRHVACESVKEAGVLCPRTETFYDWSSGREYVKSRIEDRLVFKPSGTLKDIMSYVSYDGPDMLAMLDWFEKRSKGEVEFELQDFVKGVEISTEGWFNGKEFMQPFNHTIERKQLMNDNIGPSGGCAGNVVWHLREGVDKVVEEGIAKMAPILQYHGYVGPFDFNTVINEEGVWWLENTPRFGYDALPAFLETLNQPLGDFIASMAKLEYPTHFEVKEGFGSALRLTVPPYPTDEHPSHGDLPIRGFVGADRAHLFFYDVKLEKGKPYPTTTESTGCVVALTGWGETISEALEGPMRLAEKALIPNKQYRTDLAGLFLEEKFKLDRMLEPKTEDRDADRSKQSAGTATALVG